MIDLKFEIEIKKWYKKVECLLHTLEYVNRFCQQPRRFNLHIKWAEDMDARRHLHDVKLDSGRK